MAGGPLAPPPNVYTYGAAGARDNLAARVSERDDAAGRTTYGYDSLGETSVRVFSPMDPSTGVLMMSGGRTVNYTTHTTYDRLGRLARIIYPDGEDLKYGYDAGGAVTSAASDLRAYVNSITYNEFGQRTQVTYGNGVVSNYAYTLTLHRLDTLNTVAPGATVGSIVNVQNVRYAYANNGNITDLSDGPEDTLVVGGYPGVVKQHYEYDALDQIRLATGSYGTRTTSSSYTQLFTYDAIGRMSTNALTTMSSGPTTTLNQHYLYPTAGSIGHPLHAPGQISDPTTPPNSRSFVWDANGNQTAFTGASAGTRVTVWDNENRILSIDDNGKTTTSFLYDADGERTHKVSSGTLTLYPDQWTSIRELSSGSATETNHVYAGAVRVASNVTGSTGSQAYWYHGDHLSSTNYVTDASGAVTEHLEFLPFGGTWIDENPGTDAPTPAEDFRFTGKELDGETGLTYFGARYYDSTTALWASGDPMLSSYLDGSPNEGLWNPANLEMYSYAYNAPVILRDSNGRWPSAVRIQAFLHNSLRAGGAFAIGMGRGYSPVPLPHPSHDDHPLASALGQAVGAVAGLVTDGVVGGGAALTVVGTGGAAVVVEAPLVGAAAVAVRGHAQNLGDAVNTVRNEAETARTEPHGNSRGSTRPQALYEIRNGDRTHKFGITSEPANGNGLPRVTRQVNELNRQAEAAGDAPTFTGQQIGSARGRANALEAERQLVDQHADGNPGRVGPPGNIRPQPTAR